MCITCGFTTVSSTKAAEEAAKIQAALYIGNAGATFIGNILGGLCDSKKVESQSQGPEKPKTEEVKEEEKAEESTEDKVTRLTNVDKNSDPKLFADLVKKCNSLREICLTILLS